MIDAADAQVAQIKEDVLARINKIIAKYQKSINQYLKSGLFILKIKTI